jgi:hypothetical protein
MSNLESLRKFEYRPYRLKIGFNVDFQSQDVMLHGICRDFSDAGIRAEFDGFVVVGSSGLLTLRYRSGVLSVDSQVAYIEKCQVGLVFIFKTQWQRDVTVDFITTLADCMEAPTVVRFP